MICCSDSDFDSDYHALGRGSRDFALECLSCGAVFSGYDDPADPYNRHGYLVRAARNMAAYRALDEGRLLSGGVLFEWEDDNVLLLADGYTVNIEKSIQGSALYEIRKKEAAKCAVRICWSVLSMAMGELGRADK